MLSEEAEYEIYFIDREVKRIGMSSLLSMGKCYLSDNTYDIEDKSLINGIIYGTRLGCPYNSIQYHETQEWKFRCMQVLYNIYENIIPHSLHNLNHNLPKVIKIKRSSGKIQDALTTLNDFGVRIHKSLTRNDEVPYLYVGVHFYEDYTEIPEDKIELLTHSRYYTFKEIPLQELVKINPELKTHGFRIKAHKVKYPSNRTPIQEEVINYFNELQEQWLHEKIHEIFNWYDNKNIIKCSYTIE